MTALLRRKNQGLDGPDFLSHYFAYAGYIRGFGSRKYLHLAFCGLAVPLCGDGGHAGADGEEGANVGDLYDGGV